MRVNEKKRSVKRVVEWKDQKNVVVMRKWSMEIPPMGNIDFCACRVWSYDYFWASCGIKYPRPDQEGITFLGYLSNIMQWIISLSGFRRIDCNAIILKGNSVLIFINYRRLLSALNREKFSYWRERWLMIYLQFWL